MVAEDRGGLVGDEVGQPRSICRSRRRAQARPWEAVCRQARVEAGGRASAKLARNRGRSTGSTATAPSGVPSAQSSTAAAASLGSLQGPVPPCVGSTRSDAPRSRCLATTPNRGSPHAVRAGVALSPRHRARRWPRHGSPGRPGRTTRPPTRTAGRNRDRGRRHPAPAPHPASAPAPPGIARRAPAPRSHRPECPPHGRCRPRPATERSMPPGRPDRPDRTPPAAQSAPAARSSAIQSVSVAVRPVSTRCRAPRRTSHSAVNLPRPPNAPVTRIQAFGRDRGCVAFCRNPEDGHQTLARHEHHFGFHAQSFSRFVVEAVDAADLQLRPFQAQRAHHAPKRRRGRISDGRSDRTGGEQDADRAPPHAGPGWSRAARRNALPLAHPCRDARAGRRGGEPARSYGRAATSVSTSRPRDSSNAIQPARGSSGQSGRDGMIGETPPAPG